jgi:hypothetical protein
LAAMSTVYVSWAAYGAKTKLDLVVARPSGPVTTIELRDVSNGNATGGAITFHKDNAALAAMPLDRAGQPAGAEQMQAWNQPLTGDVVRLTLSFAGRIEHPENLLVYLLDASGRRLNAVRVVK